VEEAYYKGSNQQSDDNKLKYNLERRLLINFVTDINHISPLQLMEQ